MNSSDTDKMDSLNGEGEPEEFDPDTQAQAGAANTGGGQTEPDPLAARLSLEAEDIRQVFPEFDLKSFLEEDGIAEALACGKSLWSVFAAAYAAKLQSRAEQAAALERIRSRNFSMPDVLRHGGAAGAVSPDYANMPSEQFGKLRKAYEAEMRLGRKVRV